MKIKKQQLLALVLLTIGRIIPSIFPYGVIFWRSGIRNPCFYWHNVWVGEAGFLAQNILFEDTWEDCSHGHSFPIGHFLPGYLLSICFFASAVLLVCYPVYHKYIIKIWTLIRVILVILGVYSALSFYTMPWRAIFLITVYVGFYIYLFRLNQRTLLKNISNSHYILAAYSIMFYPIWVISLAFTQQVFPFFGWLFSFIGCILLIRAGKLN